MPTETPTLPALPRAAISHIRLLVVDDHPALRTGLRDLLDDQPDFRVVASAARAKEGLALAGRTELDVAIVDYQLEGHDGLWLCRKLKRLPRPPRVIIYSAHADARLGAAAVVAQADALISKGLVGAEMWEAIRAVAGGRRLLPGVPPRLGDAIRGQLDHEEQAIFGMLWAGASPAEIAGTLGITRAGLEARLGTMLHTLQRLPAAGRSR